MNIGIYIKSIDVKRIKNYDLSKGNPGIGGTEYLYFLLAFILAENNNYTITIYSENMVDNFGVKLNNIYVKTIYDAISKAKNDEIDYFIFPPSNDIKTYELIEKINLRSITWMQNRFTYDIANYISNTTSIIVNVCASREQYDCIIDHKLWYKSVIIKNLVFEPEYQMSSSTYKPIVTYMGHLSYNRGFHLVAKQWKNVLKKVPNAHLYVIGSSNLYDTNSIYGDLGIADREYEELIKKYVTDRNGKLIDSITFCGRVGVEKYSIFKKTRVGIVNPLSREMGPLSAVEMQSCGVPVVSIRRYGQLETIRNNYSGLLVNNNSNLWKSIVRILIDDKLHSRLCENAKIHAKNNYAPDLFIKNWEDLFNNLKLEKHIITVLPDKHYFNDFKFLRIINRKIMNQVRIVELPSVLFYEKVAKSIICKIKNINQVVL